MKYMGSKNRIARFILPMMIKEANEKGITTWVEPFVGGGNMIDKVPNSFRRIGADINPYLIQALVSIRDCANELPKNNKEFTEVNYNELRKNDNYKHKGYAGFALSYGGKWLGGWCRDGLNKRDYVTESYKNAQKQTTKLQGVEFINKSYLDLELSGNSLIYCDPPYEGSTKYTGNFDHSKFWQWCRDRSREGHLVFVSEYNAPDGFECVWEKEIVSSLTQDTGSKKSVEKLFKLQK